jgi:homoserine dehydrogenase
MSKTVRIGLLGYGGVGRAFWTTAMAQREELNRRHGLDLEIVLVRRSTTQAEPNADDVEPMRWVSGGGQEKAIDEAVKRLRIDTIVQAVPSATANSAEARDQIVRAMVAGADVVTATKSPLVAHWSELERAATDSGRCIRISAAAGAALPAVDLCRRALRALPCHSVRASLNGTTNFVLNQLQSGVSQQAAVDLAVEKGICEPNPIDDLSGRDAAMKIVILANLLWGRAHTLSDVSIEGIQDGIESRLKAAAAKGRVLRSVAIARLEPSSSLEVGLQELSPQDPLARLEGAEKGVEFDCAECGTITVIGGRSSPQGAAFALLKDVVNLGTGDRAIGFG